MNGGGEMETTIPCPHVIEADGTTCGDEGGELLVQLYGVEGEMYGTDADGNRGVWHPAYVAVASVAPSCVDGCVLTADETTAAERLAEEAAENYGEG